MCGLRFVIPHVIEGVWTQRCPCAAVSATWVELSGLRAPKGRPWSHRQQQRLVETATHSRITQASRRGIDRAIKPVAHHCECKCAQKSSRTFDRKSMQNGRRLIRHGSETIPQDLLGAIGAPRGAKTVQQRSKRFPRAPRDALRVPRARSGPPGYFLQVQLRSQKKTPNGVCV